MFRNNILGWSRSIRRIGYSATMAVGNFSQIFHLFFHEKTNFPSKFFFYFWEKFYLRHEIILRKNFGVIVGI
jgi:hypothetical protein